jgi:hypothetical protein
MVTTFIEPELTTKPEKLQKAEQRLSGGDGSANLRACATWWRRNWALTHIVEVAYICDSDDLASHYAGAVNISKGAGMSYAAAAVSLSRAATTLYPSIKRLFLACGAAYIVNAEENVALYFSRTSTEFPTHLCATRRYSPTRLRKGCSGVMVFSPHYLSLATTEGLCRLWLRLEHPDTKEPLK